MARRGATRAPWRHPWGIRARAEPSARDPMRWGVRGTYPMAWRPPVPCEGTRNYTDRHSTGILNSTVVLQGSKVEKA